MRVDLLTDPRAFVALDWSAAVRADPLGTFFHTPRYLKLWWEEFGEGDLAIAVVRDGSRVAGACAFEVAGGTLRFLGGYDVTDYLGPVAFPELRAVVTDQVLDAVAELPWAHGDLRGIPVESPWLGALEEASVRRGWRVERGEDGLAPLIDLPGSFPAYLDSLPAKLRHEIRRKERRLIQECGPPVVRFASQATVGEDLDRFLTLHRASPGPKGRFMRPGMEIFFRRLAEAFLPTGVFRLAFLEIAGVGAAGAIGFAATDSVSLYNSAFDLRFARVAPGMVLVADLIRRAADEGLRRFDLLKGDLEYKYRFGARPRAIARLEVSR